MRARRAHGRTAERLVSLRARLLLPLVAASVRLLGLGRTRALIGRLAPPSRREGEDDVAAARSVAGIVASAARRGPLPVSCVPESLVLWSILARRGIDARLRLGVAVGDGTFRAHAWVELEGRPLGAAPGTGRRFDAFAHDFGAGTTRGA